MAPSVPGPSLPAHTQPEKAMQTKDPHSFAKPSEAVVTHLDLTLDADFQKQVLRGIARWDFKCPAKGTKTICFDTRDLDIQKVRGLHADKEEDLDFSLSGKDPVLGSCLSIQIPENCTQVSITYGTSPSAAALQWLQPEQTAGKQKPYLLTQSQAILARSWLPCQDSPGIRFTYDAHITVPQGMLALMSAENPQRKSADGKYDFTMDLPVPSYLMALAAGDIAFQNLGRNTGVYAEPTLLSRSASEFADMQKMMDAAESLYGGYRWGRYDVIVLPPSFPFGGMENPRLTFATPTILAGDKSLVSLIAHELAHSWSGNLVTNATWNDFWLNEGFTVYFENRIMEVVYGKDYADMIALINYTELLETIDELGKKSADTHLKLRLDKRDPDDGVTLIAYNKGFYFLRRLEEYAGREMWDGFLTEWFNRNAFKSRTTEEFLQYLHRHLPIPDPETWMDIDADVQQWVYGPGLPKDCPHIISVRFDLAREELHHFLMGKAAADLETGSWTYQQWVLFIRNLPQDISNDKLRELDAAYHFTDSGNAEIKMVWLNLCIARNYQEAFPAVTAYLTSIGRRRLILPLYKALIKSDSGRDLAKKIYEEARPGYHYVTRNTLDELLGYKA